MVFPRTHLVHLTMRHHLFLVFWLVDIWFFTCWCHHSAVTCLENVLQSNIRRGKKLGFQLSHKHRLWTKAPRQSGKLGLAQLWFVIHRKKLEEVHFADEEFLHKKVNKNDVFIRIMVCYRKYCRKYISLRRPSQALWRFDSVLLKEETRVLQLCRS